jgi:hypothetical protein
MGTQELIYYVLAAMIGAIIILLLFTVKIRSQDASIEALQYRAARKAIMDMVQYVEQDLSNIGSQHPADPTQPVYPLIPEQSITAFMDTTIVNSDTTYGWQFRGQVERGAAPQLIRYEWTKDGEVELQQGTVPTYTVERYVASQLTASSVGIVTRFELEFHFDPLVSPGWTNAHETRFIDVHVSAVSPLGPGGMIEETHYRKRFRPVAMGLRDRQM